MIWTSAIYKLLACIEGIAVWTIPAGIDVLIDVAVLLCSSKHLLRSLEMAWLGRADPIIIGDAKFLPCQLKGHIHTIHPCKRVSVMFDSCPQDMLTVLIYPDAKVRIVPLQTVITSDHIGSNLFERMSNMRRRVGIVNRGCNVVTALARIVFRF